ncbi:hypothetical protein [Ectobacillus antri]|uniref:hypothetical protein n=1 Tax=Ectobacillus antri TaxID=2486280 RepID=UPI000F599AC3|nr:hypothetical protein [Ectobacillus antri]
MNVFEGWNPIVRWVLFIPMLFITTVVLNFVMYWSITQFVGPPEAGLSSSIFHTIYRDGVTIGAAIYISCICAPRFRIIIASIYAGIYLLLAGASVVTVLIGGGDVNLGYYIFTVFMTIVGVIGGLLAVINKEKEPIKKQIMSV